MNNKLIIAISTCLVLYVLYHCSKTCTTTNHKNLQIGSKFSNVHSNRNISSTSSTHNWIKDMNEKYRETNERIQKICAQYRATMPIKFNNDEVILKHNVEKNTVIDDKYRLAYCRNAKVLYLLL